MQRNESTRIGYARSKYQDSALEHQIRMLHLAGCDKIYIDIVEAGGPQNELEHAVSTAVSGNTFLVWRLACLAPSIRKLSKLIENLDSIGVIFLSIYEVIDSSKPDGRIFVKSLSQLNDFERSVLRETTIEGQKRGRARGRPPGRRPKTKTEDIEAALNLLRETNITIERAASQYGLSSSTLRRARDLKEVR